MPDRVAPPGINAAALSENLRDISKQLHMMRVRIWKLADKRASKGEIDEWSDLRVFSGRIEDLATRLTQMAGEVSGERPLMEDYLQLVKWMSELGTLAEAKATLFARAARAAGAGWQRLGDTVGLSASGARQRWSK